MGVCVGGGGANAVQINTTVVRDGYYCRIVQNVERCAEVQGGEVYCSSMGPTSVLCKVEGWHQWSHSVVFHVFKVSAFPISYHGKRCWTLWRPGISD